MRLMPICTHDLRQRQRQNRRQTFWNCHDCPSSFLSLSFLSTLPIPTTLLTTLSKLFHSRACRLFYEVALRHSAKEEKKTTKEFSRKKEDVDN